MKKSTPTQPLKRYLLPFLLAIILSGALWVQDSLQATRLPTSDGPIELYANQTSDDLTRAFKTAIESAKHSILLSVYTLTDPQMIASLRLKSEQGVDVRVVIDAKAASHTRERLGSNIHLTQRFGHGIMHEKILVIDGKEVWLGSANMTTESLRMHGNLVAAMDSPPLAEAVSAKIHSLKVEGGSPAFPTCNFNIGGQLVELWFLPDDKQAIGRLKELIRTAEKTVRVAMFTWTRQDLANSIIEASKRGVKTEIVIDHYSGKGSSAKIVKLLKEQGVDVSLSRGGPLLHHKFLYIDGQTLVNGSANWTKAAFSENDDCFLVIHDLTSVQREHLEALWKIIREESVAPN